MRFLRWLGWGVLLSGFSMTAGAAEKTPARLALAAESAPPGSTVMAGVQLRLPSGWHTYWRHPGDSGLPVQLEWILPAGFVAGTVQWPVPEKITEASLVTYGYRDEVVLLIPLSLPAQPPPGLAKLSVKVSWLECEKMCVPRNAVADASLLIGGPFKASADAELLETWKKRLPLVDAHLPAKAWWNEALGDGTRRVVIEWATAAEATNVDFFPYASQTYAVQAPTELWPAEPGKVRLVKTVAKSGALWPTRLAGLLVSRSPMGQPRAYEVALPIEPVPGSGATASAGNPDSLAVASPPAGSLWGMLGLAFLGGLILNVMPCVLPVIALKILGFVQQSQAAPLRVRRLGWMYTAGVLTSFFILAVFVIAVKRAGHSASWGMQFGSPVFLVLLIALVLLVALNLFGLFEVNPAGRVLGIAGKLVAREGYAGAFFNGSLATVLATPCTAPFLGAALGFAFSQKPLIILAMFLTVGAGLAAPYLLLSWQPAWLKFLPKPGAWMEKFKVAMGFPMMATAVWLFTLMPLHYGRRIGWLGLFLVLLSAAAWVYGEFIQRGRGRKGLAWLALGLLAAFGFGYVLEGSLRWRSPEPSAPGPGAFEESPDGIRWERWSPEAVAKARAEGKPVFVDFTADWCLTCQANKRTSIEIPSVRARLKAIGAVALLGDYTTVPENITEELKRFGRAGVPLVLVYPRRADRPPLILPELLTPGAVLEALRKANDE